MARAKRPAAGPPGAGARRRTIEVGEGATTTALLEEATAASREALIVLAHGAGAHMDHTGMDALARVLRGEGFDVLRFNFLYRERGKGAPDRMPRLLECYRAVVDAIRAERGPKYAILGGRSMGGRAASVLAAEGYPCDGLLLLAYPLHPPGRTEQLRADHLARIEPPTLCLNGTRDSFCEAAVMAKVRPGLPARFRHEWLDAADHGFKVLKRSGRTEAELLEEIAARTREWFLEMVAGTGQH
jgi:hypothetical protein